MLIITAKRTVAEVAASQYTPFIMISADVVMESDATTAEVNCASSFITPLRSSATVLPSLLPSRSSGEYRIRYSFYLSLALFSFLDFFTASICSFRIN
jgi:hypothetical protein